MIKEMNLKVINCNNTESELPEHDFVLVIIISIEASNFPERIASAIGTTSLPFVEPNMPILIIPTTLSCFLYDD